MTYLTIPQLAKKYNIHPNVIYRLIREGFPFKWQKVSFEVKRKGYKDTKFPPRKVMIVNEEDWLNIPTFIRNKWRRGERRKITDEQIVSEVRKVRKERLKVKK